MPGTLQTTPAPSCLAEQNEGQDARGEQDGAAAHDERSHTGDEKELKQGVEPLKFEVEKYQQIVGHPFVVSFELLAWEVGGGRFLHPPYCDQSSNTKEANAQATPSGPGQAYQPKYPTQ